jgi:hypothetical protein
MTIASHNLKASFLSYRRVHHSSQLIWVINHYDHFIICLCKVKRLVQQPLTPGRYVNDGF